MKSISVLSLSALVAATVVVAGCSSGGAGHAKAPGAASVSKGVDDPVRRADCLKVQIALREEKASHPPDKPSEFVKNAPKRAMRVFRTVQPQLRDPELAAAFKTAIEVSEQADALKDGGSSEARGKLNMRFIAAVNVYTKACGLPSGPGGG